MALKDFYATTTKKFDVLVEYNGTTPDISNDSVELYLKDKYADSSFTFTSSADVSSSGSQGIAKFNLTPSTTSVTSGKYFYEIVWTISGSNEVYVLENGSVEIKDRLSD